MDAILNIGPLIDPEGNTVSTVILSSVDIKIYPP